MPSKFDNICGIDEAGRGALAGPLVAAAVILTIPFNKIIKMVQSPVRDSKTLSHLQRHRIVTLLQKIQIPTEIEIISVNDINRNGIGWANKEAMRRLIERTTSYDYILDGKLNLGNFPGREIRVTSIVDADAHIPAVILAGIVAKEYRDSLMLTLHTQYPCYGWQTNKGYGTATHIRAIKINDICEEHRSIFVATALRNSLVD